MGSEVGGWVQVGPGFEVWLGLARNDSVAAPSGRRKTPIAMVEGRGTAVVRVSDYG